MKVSHVVKMDEEVFWSLQAHAQQMGMSFDDYLTKTLEHKARMRDWLESEDLQTRARHDQTS